jgi:hypothetical protein
MRISKEDLDQFSLIDILQSIEPNDWENSLLFEHLVDTIVHTMTSTNFHAILKAVFVAGLALGIKIKEAREKDTKVTEEEHEG